MKTFVFFLAAALLAQSPMPSPGKPPQQSLPSPGKPPESPRKLPIELQLELVKAINGLNEAQVKLLATKEAAEVNMAQDVVQKKIMKAKAYCSGELQKDAAGDYECAAQKEDPKK